MKCKQCSSGTFSDTESYTDPCWPHTEWVKERHVCIQRLETLWLKSSFLHSCGSRAVVRKGNATSDTVCEPVVLTSSTQPSRTELPTKSVLTTASETLHSTSTLELTDYTQSQSVFNYSTKSPTPNIRPDIQTLGTLTGLVFWAVIRRRLISASF